MDKQIIRNENSTKELLKKQGITVKRYMGNHCRLIKNDITLGLFDADQAHDTFITNPEHVFCPVCRDKVIKTELITSDELMFKNTKGEALYIIACTKCWKPLNDKYEKIDGADKAMVFRRRYK